MTETRIGVAQAIPGDVYADADGKLWRVQWVCQQPTACLVEIEVPPRYETNLYDTASMVRHQPPPEKKIGVVNAPIFDGFHRILPAPPSTNDKPFRVSGGDQGKVHTLD